MEAKVKFVACDNPSVTPRTIHFLAAVAEAEAPTISARTKAYRREVLLAEVLFE
jgi:hypothetical protein